MALREHPNDILLIKNVDIDCGHVNSEIIRKDRTKQDDNGHNYIAYTEELEEWNHADFFQVKFDGYPHRIRPGATKRMPRYLAEHYAKHLANHMLQKKEGETNRVNLVNSPTERPRMLKLIVLGVEEYFYDNDDNLDMEVGARAAREVDRLNPRERRGTELAGIEDHDPVPNKALGRLEDGPAPESLEDVLSRVDNDEPASKERDKAKAPLDDLEAISKRELVEAAHSQGIAVTGKETKQELANKIKQTA